MICAAVQILLRYARLMLLICCAAADASCCLRWLAHDAIILRRYG